MELQVTSERRFLKHLEKRINAWRAARPVKFTVTVPPELSWWYYQEFGTATEFKPPKPAGKARIATPRGNRSGGKLYKITAKEEGRFLRYPRSDGQPGYVTKKMVMHPGVRPSRSVTMVVPEIERDLARQARQAFQRGAADNPDILRAEVKSAVEHAVDRMARSLDSNLKSREDGKLGGRSPGGVFADAADIVEGDD